MYTPADSELTLFGPMFSFLSPLKTVENLAVLKGGRRLYLLVTRTASYFRSFMTRLLVSFTFQFTDG